MRPQILGPCVLLGLVGSTPAARILVFIKTYVNFSLIISFLF